MLNFVRNKLVSVERQGQDVLVAHGLLDDDIYSLEIEVSVNIQNLEILAIDGRWNRWTTPECPRAIPFLQEAVGFRIEERGFSTKVQKIISRKACRHHANLLLECCHCAREAAMLVEETERNDVARPIRMTRATEETVKERVPGGMIIDLHVHSFPASRCSSAPVDGLLDEAKRIGLDAICLTDHNHLWDSSIIEDLKQKHGFLILAGSEITTEQGDMLVFGLKEDIKGIIRLEQLRQQVLRAGGFMIAAHPFRGFLTFGLGRLGLTPERAMQRQLFKWVDAVEVLNGMVTEKENSLASRVSSGLGLPATGGSDAHEINKVGLYATQFFDGIKNESDLIEALKGGKYSPIAFKR
ncbi:MAG: PHP domain-containing protein [Thermodesulfobacteriota bacterium]|nr:PHP domain-containing protein [Thermodesulfobacteriota bacterium]